MVCQLFDFAIITYLVPPERLRPHIPQRFELETIMIKGKKYTLLSIVPFRDKDFTLARYPFPKFNMQQTNYRIYIKDRETNERGVWFLGTVLDSWSRFVPNQLWKLPWHSGRIKFDCDWNEEEKFYSKYKMRTLSDWAPAAVEISQSKEDEIQHPGFGDEEDALLCLTHPMNGFYFRTDGKLGSYSIWHKRLGVHPAKMISARFGLLERMRILNRKEQQTPYSVLLDHHNEFTVYLPPKIC